MDLLFLLCFEFGSKSVAFIGKILFGKISAQSCTGRARLHGPCWVSVKKEVCPRPPDTGRAGLHGGPCKTPDFSMGFGFGSSTGRVGLHGPCQLLMFEFLEKLF